MKKQTVTRIKLDGVKGRTGTHELAPLTAIVAPNGSGKSAIMDAVRLALVGYLPHLPKTGQGVMRLAGGPAMSVTATLADGEVLSRKWEMNAKGSVKATAMLPDGWNGDAMATVFSPAEFIRKSPKERAAILLADASGTSTLAVPEVETLRDTVDRECTGASRLTINEIDPFAPKLADAATFLEALEDELVESRKAHKRDKARLETTIQGMEDAVRGADAPAAVEAEAVDASSAKLRELVETATRLTERHQGMLRQRQRAESIGDGVKWSPDDDARLDKARAEHGEIEGDIMAARRIDEAIAAVLKTAPEPEEVEDARAVLAATAAIPTPEASKETCLAKRDEANSKLEAIGKTQHHLAAECKRLTDELAELTASECCPTCGASGATLKDIAIEHFGQKLELVQQKQKQAADERADAEAAEMEATATLAVWAKLEEADAANRVIAADQAADAELERLRNEEKPESRPDLLEEKAEEIRELIARKTAAAELAKLGDIPTLGAVEAAKSAATTAEMERSAHEAEFLNLKRAREAYVSHGAQGQRIEEQRTALEATTKKLERVEELVAETVAAKQKLAAAVIGPMMETVNFFTAGILPGKLEAEGAEIQYSDEAGTRDFAVLSGSEQAVIAFALASALAANSPVPVAMLDEASTMDVERRTAFLERVASAVRDGVLCQAIVLDWNAENFGEEWQRIAF